MADNMNSLPPLPEGFTLDSQSASKQDSLPPLPEGFTLDAPIEFGEEAPKQPAQEPEEIPKWAGEHPNLYGAYGAGKAILEDAITPSIETVGTIVGGIVGGGSTYGTGTLVGSALGYATSKQLMDIVEEYYARIGGAKPKDRTVAGEITKSTKDVALVLGTGAAFSAGGAALRKLYTPLFEKLPERLYASALKMPLSKKWVKVLPGKEVSARKLATVEGIKSKVRPSDYGIEKIRSLEKEVRTYVDDVVETLSPDPNNKISVKKVIENGLKKVYEKVANTADPEGMKALVDDMAEKFKAHGEYLTPKNAQAIKKQLYKELKWLGPPDQIAAEAKKGIAKELMLSLERIEPSLKELNEQDAARIYLTEAIENAVGRNANKNMVSLGSKVLLAHPKTWPLAFWEATLGHPQVKTSIAFALSKANPAKYSKFIYPEKPLGYIAPIVVKDKGVYRYAPAPQYNKSSIPAKLKTKLWPAEPKSAIRNKMEVALEKEEKIRLQHLEDMFAKEAKKKANVGSPLIKPDTTYQKAARPAPLKTELHPAEPVSPVRNKLDVILENEASARQQQMNRVVPAKSPNIGSPLIKPDTTYQKAPKPLSVNERLKILTSKDLTSKQRAAIAELQKRGKL